MEENPSLQFIRDLYSKYNIQLDPEREQKVLSHFNRDFDQSLSVFYEKYNPDKLKDLTPEKISTWKNAYGISMPEMAVEPQEEQLEGKDISAFQSILNSTSNTWDAIKAMPQEFVAGNMAVMGWLDSQIQKTESFLPKEAVDAARKGYSYLTWLPQLATTGEISDNVNDAIAKMAEISIDKTKDALPTKEFLDEAREGNLGGIAATAIGGFMGYVPSLIVGAATKGGGFVPYFAGGGIVTGAKSKSEEQGVSIEELFRQGDADYVVPTVIGGLAGALERYGLKQLGKTLTANLTKSGIDSFKKMVVTSGQQSFINWVEAGMHKFVEDYSKESGDASDIERNAMAALSASKSAASFLFSEEGFNAGAEAGLGTMVMGGLSKAGNSGFRRITGKDSVETRSPEELQKAAEENAIKKGEEKFNEVFKKEEEVIKEASAVAKKMAEEVEAISPELESEISNIIDAFIGEKRKEVEEEAVKENETGESIIEKTPTEEVKAKEAENTKAVDEKAKEIAKNVRDKQSLRSAVTTFLGLNPNSKDDLATATTVSEFIDGIVGSRAKREGITKEEWYKTRVQIGRKDAPEGSKMVDGAMSTILEDGRTLISAFGKSNPLDFLREFGKVIYKDLNESELSAFREVFGIDFQKGIAEDTAMGEFAAAFEAYVESGKANTEALTGRNAPFIKAAFEKMKQWIFDIKENIASLLDGEGSVYVSPQIKSLFDAIVTGTEITPQNAQTGTETSTVTDVQSDTTVAKDSGVVTETTGRQESEIIDLTDTQETIGDEQTTETTDGERVEQTPPSDKKDRESAKKPDTSADSKQADKRKAAGRKIDVSELTKELDSFDPNSIDRTSSGTIGAIGKRKIKGLQGKIEKALAQEGLRASDKKFLDKKLKDLNKITEDNIAYEEEIRSLREKNEAKVSEMVDSGVTKAQAESFIRKNPTAEVLSFEDGLIVYTDETGELMSFEPKVGKTYKEKETEKRRADINDRRVREAEEAIERESKEKKSAEQKKSVDRQDKLANQAFSYMTRSDDRKFSAANIRRIIERLSKINLLGEEWKDVKDIAGLPINKFKEEVRNYVESFVSQRLNSGAVPAYLKSFIKEDLSDLGKALEGLDLSEKQRTSINAYVQNLSDEILGREQSKKTAEVKKIERQAKANEKTAEGVWSGKPMDVIGLSEKSSFAKITESLLKGFGLWGKEKLILINLSFTQKNDEALRDYLTEFVSNAYRKEDFDKAFNDIYNEILSLQKRGVKGNSITLPGGYSIITFPSESSDTNKISSGFSSIHILLHELGHVITERLIESSDKKTKKSIQDSYENWLKENEKKGDKKVTESSPVVLSILSLNETELVSGESSTILLPGYFPKYYSKFNEFLAEQFAYWAETKESPKSVIGNFIKGIVDVIKKIVGVYNVKFNESIEVQNFLNEHFRYLKDKDKSKLRSSLEAIKNSSVEIGKELVKEKRLLSDLNNDLDSIKSSKPVVPTGVDPMEVIRSRKEQIKSLELSISKVEGRISKIESVIKDHHDAYTNMNPTEAVSIGDYMKVVLEESEELLADNLTRDIIRRSKNDGEKFLEDKKKSQGIVPGSDKDAFHASIAKAVTGKFSSTKQFESIVNAINTKLKDAGKTALSKADAKDIYYRTPFGKISKIKKPLYTSIQKKGTKSKMALFESIDASKADRDKAQQEIEDIMLKYVANWKNLPIGRSAVTRKLKKDKNVTPQDFVRIAELELVGLIHAEPSVIDAYVKDGHLGKIMRNESSKIEKIANENRSQRNYETGRAFLMDAIGFKENSDGTLTGKMAGKDVKLKVHRMKEAYQNGELVEHLGAVYRANKDIEAGTTFKQDNFDKVYSFNIHRTKAERDKLEGFLGRAKKFIANAALSSHGIESLIARLSRESTASQMEGEISKLIGEDGFRKASIQSTKDFRAIEVAIDNLGKKLFGVKTVGDVHKKLYDARTKEHTLSYKDNDGNTIKKKFYLSELMDLYAAMLQPSLEQRFEGMKNKKGIDASDTKFWNDSKAASIRDAIPQEYKSFVEGVITDIMPSMYENINKTFKEINGYDLINIQNYFPLSYDVKQETATELDPQMNDIASFITSVSNKNLKDRSVGGAILPGDFVRKMYSYSSRAIHYSNYAVPMKKAVSLFDMSAHYGGFFESVNGKEIMEHIHWNLNNIAANSAAKYNQNRYVDILRGLSIGGAFMANLTMIPKQFSSFAAYAWKMPAGTWVKYMAIATPQQRIKDVKEIVATDWFQERWRQGGRVSLDTMRLMIDNLSNEINKSGAERKYEYYTAKINSLLFSPTRVGDVGAILLGGGAYWNHLKKEAATKFPNDSVKQKEWVEIKFAEQSSRTQQSRDMLDASKWSTSGSIASLLTTFMSTPMLYGRVLSGGIKDMQRGYSKGDKKLFAEGAKSVILFSLVLPYLFFASSNASLGYLSDLWSDDDEDEGNPIKQTLAMAAIAFTQHIPILYPLLQNTVDKTMLDREFDLGIVPTFSILGKAQDSAIRLSERIQEDGGLDFSDEAVMRDISNVGKAAGINIASMANLYEAWSNFDESIEENPFLLMGYSRRSLKLDK